MIVYDYFVQTFELSWLDSLQQKHGAAIYLGALQRKKSKKSEITMEVGGWDLLVWKIVPK